MQQKVIKTDRAEESAHTYTLKTMTVKWKGIKSEREEQRERARATRNSQKMQVKLAIKVIFTWFIIQEECKVFF